MWEHGATRGDPTDVGYMASQSSAPSWSMSSPRRTGDPFGVRTEEATSAAVVFAKPMPDNLIVDR